MPVISKLVAAAALGAAAVSAQDVCPNVAWEQSCLGVYICPADDGGACDDSAQAILADPACTAEAYGISVDEVTGFLFSLIDDYDCDGDGGDSPSSPTPSPTDMDGIGAPVCPGLEPGAYCDGTGDCDTDLCACEEGQMFCEIMGGPVDFDDDDDDDEDGSCIEACGDWYPTSCDDIHTGFNVGGPEPHAGCGADCRLDELLPMIADIVDFQLGDETMTYECLNEWKKMTCDGYRQKDCRSNGVNCIWDPKNKQCHDDVNNCDMMNGFRQCRNHENCAWHDGMCRDITALGTEDVCFSHGKRGKCLRNDCDWKPRYGICISTNAAHHGV